MRYRDKTAVITGGGTGIGAAVARKLASEGANLALIGRRREPLEAIALETGGTIVQADAADSAAMAAAVADIVERFGGIDVLVANAGGHGAGVTTEMTDETWALATRLNLDTAFVSVRACLPSLVERKGAIVVVSSIAGLFAAPEAIGYITMKHALIGLAKSLARDYGRKGVRTNTVCPGWVRTPMADEEMQVIIGMHGLKSLDEAYAMVTKDVPLGKPALPEDVANAIAFLASSEAAMINGAVLTIDGGAGTVDLPTLAFVE